MNTHPQQMFIMGTLESILNIGKSILAAMQKVTCYRNMIPQNTKQLFFQSSFLG